jgi:hypothetical protein
MTNELIGGIASISIGVFLAPFIVHLTAGCKMPFRYWYENDPMVRWVMKVGVLVFVLCVIARVANEVFS